MSPQDGLETKIRLWGVGTSRTIRPHWMLCELGLAYEVREIIPRTDSMKDPDFLKVSQRCKVPILEDGDLVIGESAAMVMHLADHYRDRSALAPLHGTPERSRFDELCFFIMVELDALLYVIRRHDGLPDVYGKAPVAVAAAREYFLRQAATVELWLGDGRPHLIGEDFSGADVLLSSCLEWARFYEIPLSQGLESYRARVTERPAYREAVAKNFPPAAIAALRKG